MSQAPMHEGATLMGERWCVKLRRIDLEHAASLRLEQTIEGAIDNELAWLRGPELDDVLAPRVLSLPVEDRYRVAENDLLFRTGERTPAGRIPELRWRPLAELLPVELPVARFLEGRVARQSLQLQASPEPYGEAVLLVAARDWLRWGEAAPTARLKRLSFALSSCGRVLVRGRPLPPIRGREFSLCDDVLTPAGLIWSPRVSPETVRELAGVEDGELAMFRTDGCVETVPLAAFVAASRTAIRMSCRDSPDHGREQES